MADRTFFAKHRILIAFLTITIMLTGLVWFSGCQKQSSESQKTESSPALEVEEVKLNQEEMTQLIGAAKALLDGGDLPSLPAKLTDKQPSALFLSMIWPNRTAEFTFSTGDSLIDALKSAASALRLKPAIREAGKGRLRIDVVTDTKKPFNLTAKASPRFRLSIEGLYLQTDPPVALHPLEIVSRGIYRHEHKSGKTYRWTYKNKYMKKALELRELDRSLAAPINTPEGVRAQPLKLQSFVEEENGNVSEVFRWNREDIKITPDLLFARAKLAGNYLMGVMDDQGKFDYRYYPAIDSSTKSYNLLRHCGTVYSMVQLYEITKNEEVIRKAKLGLDFAKQFLSPPKPEDQDQDWVCLRGEGYGRQRNYCKLGGAGLYLVALSKYTLVTGDKQYVDLMEDLARFIQHQQLPDGDTLSKYYFDNSKNTFKSLFYPGESAYGLGLLAQVTGDKHWVKVGNKTIAWLENSRKGTPSNRLPVDHWLIIAMNELYRLDPVQANKQHAFDIAKGMAQSQRLDKRAKHQDTLGGWGSNPQSSANGTRTEGLVAAYRMAEFAGDDPEPFFATIESALNTLVRMQYTDVSVSYFPKPEKALGGFVDKMDIPAIQIDNVQHPLSGIIGSWHIMNDRKGRNAERDLYYKWRDEVH